MALALASSSSTRRAAITSQAPRRASSHAVAAPMPELAPVMMTIFPASAGERALASFCSLLSLASFICFPLFFPRLGSTASIRHAQRSVEMPLLSLLALQEHLHIQEQAARYKQARIETGLYSPAAAAPGFQHRPDPCRWP